MNADTPTVNNERTDPHLNADQLEARPRAAYTARDGIGTRPLIDRIDRLAEDAHGIDSTDDADDLTAELEAALDDLNAAIAEADRDPDERESAAIAEAERILDELANQEEE